MVEKSNNKGHAKPLAKAKRTRAYAPKCDEERPTCLRCREGGWKCDGYAPVTKRSTNKTTCTSPCTSDKENSNVKDALANPTTQGAIVKMLSSQTPTAKLQSAAQLLPRPTSLDTLESLLERRFLGHFFKFTLNSISSSYDTGNFWLWTLPNLIQDQRLIRHSITALGAAHWMFQSDGLIAPNQITHYNAFIHRQYTMAISHLIPIMSNNQSENIELVLVSCLLFIYLETLQGHHAEALRHLISGQKLLKNLSQRDSMSPVEATGMLPKIATLFRALGSIVNAFGENKILSDLTVYAKPMHGPGDPNQPYDSLTKAMDDLTLLELELSDIQCPEEEAIKRDSGLEEERDRQQQVYDAVIERFLIWDKRFSETEKVMSPSDNYDFLNLKVQQAMWQLVLEEKFDEEPELQPGECWPLLDMIEKMLIMTPSTQRTFALRADLIPPLIGIYGACKDFSVRRRTITLLRLRRRKELVWDGEEAADFLENDLKMCMIGLKTPSWPDIGPLANKNALLCYDDGN
ncbi:unnamed protein product [Clonostachys chloroleuca]|uniref:Zn(2)-C6 fungal-type domain-containing protein n=1 Tax=Clonostachys chloroleuca TaxID=1926264 RepID=A0AA35QG06_9HYPO|nr:unnamed protein product [Clonostachys chloroleuca]